MTKDNASGAGMEPVGWQFRFVFPTHASNWKSVLELPMSEMKDGDGYRYERRYVYVCTGSTDATRLLAESQAHNAKLEAQVERLRDEREQLREIAQAWADAFEGKRKANEAGQPGFEFNDQMYHTLGRAQVALDALKP